jgi:hypothetical protein
VAQQEGMTMTDTIHPRAFPGYSRDLNDGAPQTWSDLFEALCIGLTTETAHETIGQMGTAIKDREVFATVRGEEHTYWVTGVVLHPHEPGSESLAGAIELVLEAGDDAQTRADEKAEAEKLDRTRRDLADALYRVAMPTALPEQEPPTEWWRMADGILRANPEKFGLRSPAAW